MKKALFLSMILFAFLLARWGEEIGPMAGVGVGFSFISGEGNTDVGFTMSVDGITPIYDGLCARAGLLTLWAGDATTFTFSTGTDIDLMYIAKLSGGIEPYGFAGYGLTTTSGWTFFGFRFGGGMNYELPSAPIKLAGELGFTLSSSSTSYGSHTQFGFNMMFGVRFGK